MTVEVKTLLIDGISINMPGQIDIIVLPFTACFIVSFQAEIQYAFDDFNWNSSTEIAKRYNKLREYAKIHGITFTPQYNCPA